MIKCVRRTDRLCALIKGEIEEPDAKDYPDEDELISDQEDLMDEEHDDDSDEDEDYRPICHTMDGHSSGSFVFTGIGFGIDKKRTSLTRFTDRK